MEEINEDIVIVGAGIAGLATSLGLHRVGLRSLVLEASDSLRATGFAFATWTNAWRALDALGIGDSLRQQHDQLFGVKTFSTISGVQTSEMSFVTKGKLGEHEVRRMVRKVLLEALSKDLPSGTIRFSSKLVSIEDLGLFKLVHLADGTIIRTKVLIGCDGVNSVVAKWLGFNKARFAGRSSIRGCVSYKDVHGFKPEFLQFFGDGVRFGVNPFDSKSVYWFFTWRPSSKQERSLGENPAEMKQFVLSKLGKMPDKVKAVIENTTLDSLLGSQLRYRNPLELLWRDIAKSNVCIAGDALHCMTPDIGQGGCAALEDGVVLARCLGEAFRGETSKEEEKEEFKRAEIGLKKYAKERKWRSFELITIAYVVGRLQECHGKIMTSLRDKYLAKFLTGLLLKNADFDCGKLMSLS